MYLRFLQVPVVEAYQLCYVKKNCVKNGHVSTSGRCNHTIEHQDPWLHSFSICLWEDFGSKMKTVWPWYTRVVMEGGDGNDGKRKLYGKHCKEWCVNGKEGSERSQGDVEYLSEIKSEASTLRASSWRREKGAGFLAGHMESKTSSQESSSGRINLYNNMVVESAKESTASESLWFFLSLLAASAIGIKAIEIVMTWQGFSRGKYYKRRAKALPIMRGFN